MQVCISAASLAEYCHHAAHESCIRSQAIANNTYGTAWCIAAIKDFYIKQTFAADWQQKEKLLVEIMLERGFPCPGIERSKVSKDVYNVGTQGRIDRHKTPTEAKTGIDRRQHVHKSERARHALPDSNAMSPDLYVASSSVVGHLALRSDIRLGEMINKAAIWTEQT